MVTQARPIFDDGRLSIADSSAHIRTRSTPEESLALPTMLLAFCAEGFALSLEHITVV